MLPALFGLMIMLPPSQASAEHVRELMKYGDVAIDVIIDGNGPAIVLLPSLARDSEDYDAVARGLANAGYRVLAHNRAGSAAAGGR